MGALGASLEPFQQGDVVDGRYLIVDQVARGGMSTVWRAHDRRLERDVAIKALHTMKSTGHPRQLSEEARRLARLRHPHIAAVYDVNTDANPPYLVMELVDGDTLGSVLDADGPLPWPAAVTVCGQVAQALAAAHAIGVVHRDVAPTNVLVTEAGARLIDFGISAVAGSVEADPGGTLRGTPPYVAPERLRGQLVAPAGDIYALGVLLYRCLTGQLPWRGDTPEQLLAAQDEQEPEPLPLIRGLPAEVRELCRRCLAKDPAARPDAATAGAILRVSTQDRRRLGPALGQFHAHERHRSGRAVAAALGAVVLLGGVAWWNADGSRMQRPIEAAARPRVDVLPTACDVTYEPLLDDGVHFTALIAVRHRGPYALSDWRLTFQLPGDQQVDPRAGWEQEGLTVNSSTGRPVLAPGEPVILQFAGTHRGPQSVPTSFFLGEQRCAVTILGGAGPDNAALTTTDGEPAVATSSAANPPADTGSDPATTPPGKAKKDSAANKKPPKKPTTATATAVATADLTGPRG